MSEIAVTPYNVSGGKAIPSMPMKAWNITLSDTNTYQNPIMVECLTDGTVVVLPWAGSNDGTETPVSRAMVAGQVLNFAVKKVLASGTTGTYGGLF